MVFKIKSIKEQILDNQREAVTQEEFVKNLTASLYANQRLIDTDGADIIKHMHVIVVNGAQGTGKTYLTSQIANSFGVPVKTISYRDCTMESISNLAMGLLEKTNWDFELAGRGIIIIDDISERNNKSVDQNNSIISFINDKLYVNLTVTTEEGDQDRSLDTSKVTYILITDDSKKTRRAIGFGDREDIEVMDDSIELLSKLSVPITTVSTKEYTLEDYKKFVLESSNSPLTRLNEYLQSFDKNKKILYTSRFINALIEKAYKKKCGVKGLIEIFGELKDDIITMVVTSDGNGIIIDENIFDKTRTFKK